MATPKQPRTNEQRMTAFLKDIDSFELVLVIERLELIMKETMESIVKDPEQWKKSIVHYSAFERLNVKIERHFGKDDK